MNSNLTHVLVVSNDGNMLSNTSRFLSVFGYRVSTLNCAGRCLEAVRLCRPDIVLADGRAGSGMDCNRLRGLCNCPWLDGARVVLLADLEASVDLIGLVNAGADDVLESGCWGELLARLRAVSRLCDFEKRLWRRSDIDPETRLRRADTLDALLSELWSPDCQLACLHVTLDHAAELAHWLGQETWQRAMRAAGDVLASLTPRPLAVATLGEGRFRVLLADDTQPAPGEQAEQLRHAMEQEALKVGEGTLTLTISCGLSHSRGCESSDDFLQRAELAALSAVERGGSLVVTDEERQTLDDQWHRFADPETLYQSTTACHLMTPFTWMVRSDEGMRRAAALLAQSGHQWLPVVDEEGRYRGLLHNEAVGEDLERLVDEACDDAAPRLAPDVPFAEVLALLEEGHRVAVVLRDQTPAGMICAQDVAALDQLPRPTATAEPLGTSDLLIEC